MEIPMKVRKQSVVHRRISRASQTSTYPMVLLKSKRKKPLPKNVTRNRLCICSPAVSYGVGDFPVIWNELRTNMQLCDGVVRCDDDREFKVHRAILSAVSPYFKALFTNSINRGQPEETEAYLDMPADIFCSILDFAYTGKLLINNENVQSLLMYADQLEIVDIVKLCTQYIINNLNYTNCLSIHKFAKQYFLKDLEHKSGKYMRHHFVDFLEYNPDYYSLSVDELCEILDDDELNVKCEDDVYNAIRLWVTYNVQDRKYYIPKLLKCVRFGLMSVSYFSTHVWHWNYVRNSLKCQKILYSVTQYLSDKRRELQLYSDYRDKLMKSRIPYEILFAFGGWSDGSPIGFIETFDSKAKKWVVVREVHMSPRAYHGLCAMGGLIYLIGGFDGNEHFNTVRSFNPATYEWRDHACMYYPRCYVSVAIVHERIYAIGGYNGKARMSSVERYDPDNNQWELLAPMNLQRSDASAAVVDNKIYVVGGFNGQEVLRSAEVYDPDANQWSYICQMGDARSGVSLVAYKDCLYALGGFNGFRRLASAERFAPNAPGQWEPVADMSCPRSNFAAELMDNMLYVVGGFDGKGTIPFCECYDFCTNTWYEMPSMNLNRSALNACTLCGLPNARDFSLRKSNLHGEGSHAEQTSLLE